MTVDGRTIGGEKIRERLSYRSLDVEQIGSVYETVMGFTACRAGATMIALQDKKKLPTFVGLDTLLAMKPADRQKWLKDHAVKLSAKQAKAVEGGRNRRRSRRRLRHAGRPARLAGCHTIGAGTPYLQPTDERRRSGSHYTPRSLTEPIVRHALEPAFERIGPHATPEAILSLKVLDPPAVPAPSWWRPAASSAPGWNRPGSAQGREAGDPGRRGRGAACETPGRPALPLRRRPNPMAVDLAKLSLWLATLASEHEFTFLDHALKSGDSLVGLTKGRSRRRIGIPRSQACRCSVR